MKYDNDSIGSERRDDSQRGGRADANKSRCKMDRAACYSGRRYASASVKTPWRSRNYDALKGTELMDKRDRGAGGPAVREGIVKIHGESESNIASDNLGEERTE